MAYDNQVLDINGPDEELLKKALVLAFEQGHHRASHWREEHPHGLILLWHGIDKIPSNQFMTPMTAEAVAPMVWEWLKDEVKTNRDLYPEDPYFDGSTSVGWRVSCGKRNFNGDNFYRICTIKPEILYYGK